MAAEGTPKAALRVTALRARRSLTEGERERASASVVERLLAIPEILRAKTLLTYAPMSEEPDVSAALHHLHQRGTRTLFPRVRGTNLDLVAASDLLTLRLGYRGIREPVGNPVDPDVVDVAVVPGVAFDLHGVRLGHGGGHYDRLLAQLPERCMRIGVAFACQVVPWVPNEPHDEPVDAIVTESSFHLTHARPRDVPS